MKFIHVSDVHANRERLESVRKVFDCIYRTVKDHDIGLVIFAGDFWDSTITNTKASGFTEYVEMVHQLRQMCQVVFIYGTPKHEPKGALDVFSSIGCTVIDTPKRVVISTDSGAADILAIPEPRRGDYIGISTEETNSLINKSYVELSKNKKEGKPFVVAFHGEVTGSKYQNGMDSKSSIQFPVELLKSMGADYYALGHIHMPQEVFKNAHYPGSPAPVDFGEQHEGCIHLVEISDKTVVTPIKTNAPSFITVELDSVGVNKFDPKPYSGKHLRLIVNNGTDSDSPHTIVSTLKSKSDLLSCKVIVNRDVQNIIRSSNIANKVTSLGKYEEYCKIAKYKVSHPAKDFLRSIDDNKMLLEHHPSKTFELQSISLRGSIGIKCGTRQEEINIDFTNYKQGVVAMVGDNGRGKTTIIENCHPYPKMLTRKKTLKEHFFLKDSHRHLVYRASDGTFLRIQMNIDAASKHGSTIYLAQTSKDGNKWENCIDTDGSLDAYQGFVERTFGPIELFIRTSFFTKKETKGTPDLTTATKSEKIDFFSSLAGNDWLQEVSDMAKEAVSDAKKSAEKIEIKMEEIDSAQEELEECNEEIEELQEQISDLQDSMKSLEKKVKDVEAYEADRKEKEALAKNACELKAQIEENLKSLTEDIEDNNEKLVLYNEVTKWKTELSRIEELYRDNEGLSDVVSSTKDVVLVLAKSIDNMKDQMNYERKNYSDMQILIANIDSEITLHRAQANIYDENCPVCGAELSHEKAVELNLVSHNHEQEANELETKKGLLQERATNALLASDDASSKLVEFMAKKEVADAKLLEVTEKKSRIDNELKQIQDKLADESNISFNVLYHNRGMVFDVDIVTKLQEKQAELKSRLSEIQSVDIPPSRQDELVKLTKEYDIVKADIASSKGEIKALKARVTRLNKLIESAETLKSELKELEEKITSYTHIQNSFSKTGIPLMELESAMPEIADMANGILEQSYGDRFTISFETIRQGNKKAVDDLNIVVYDSQQGMSKYIDMVCSGEEVWIKQALFYAFSIVRMNRTGFSFATRFIDESDSSLDTGSRAKYLSMIEAAHKLTGASLSILITHSQEIKDIAEQIIEV